MPMPLRAARAVLLMLVLPNSPCGPSAFLFKSKSHMKAGKAVSCFLCIVAMPTCAPYNYYDNFGSLHLAWCLQRSCKLPCRNVYRASQQDKEVQSNPAESWDLGCWAQVRWPGVQFRDVPDMPAVADHVYHLSRALAEQPYKVQVCWPHHKWR